MIYAALNQPARAIHDFLEVIDLNLEETAEVQEAKAYIAQWVKDTNSDG